MKPIIVWLLLCCCGYGLRAQSVLPHRYGPAYKGKYADYYHFLAPQKNQPLWSAQERRIDAGSFRRQSRLTIKQFDSKTLALTASIDHKPLNRNTLLMGLLSSEATTQLLYRDWTPGPYNQQIKVQKIDPSTMKMSGSSQLLVGDANIVEASHRHSPNGAHFLVQTIQRIKDKPKQLGIGFYGFDRALNKHYGTVLTLGGSINQAPKLPYWMDNQGNAYCVLTRKPAAGTTPLNANGQVLVKIAVKDGTIKELPLPMEGYQITHLTLTSHPSTQHLVIAGSYGHKDVKIEGGIGFFLLEMDETGTILTNNRYPIPPEYYTLYEPQKERHALAQAQKKGMAALKGLEVRSIAFTPTGQTVINAEISYVIRYYSSTSALKNYIKEDLWVLALDENKEQTWLKKIPRRQAALREPSFTTYRHLYHQGKHYYLYWGFAENLVPNLKEKVELISNSDSPRTLTCLTIDEATGAHQHYKIVNSAEHEPRLVVDKWLQEHLVTLPNGKMVTFFRMKNDRFIALEFELPFTQTKQD